ncbi:MULTISPECIES: DUF2505 domain-containing protein [Dermabacter]|uniref:DUF2505 domain-containing protein n=1 Tax=Dermabacter vaginalis TaxID=1630135 RepID=A0ABX6A4Q7_9MICO|nr:MULTISPECIES: DUF2505 domain-containing protein [Dermabacter]MCG7442991.1 DUF2505 domain-containing protein [Dermabacter vaginalis]QEU11546.1 DUF2505 domain-containing protein [Dermabacter vaginalis]RUP87509.1 DUF2505 domain-containing protein [Dermabacter sp. HSID17554]
MKTLHETIEYNASTEEVAHFYASRESALERASRLGVRNTRVEVQGDSDGAFTTTILANVPREQVNHEKFRRFLPEHLEATIVHEWDAPSGGARTGRLRATVASLPVNLSADFTLEGNGEHSRMKIEAQLSVKIPLVGGAVEKAGAEAAGEIFRTEESFANEVLRRER